MTKPSDRATAKAFWEWHAESPEWRSAYRPNIWIPKRAAEIDDDGMWSGAIPRGVQEALQRMIEDTFVRGPASVEDGRLVQKWAERFNRSEAGNAAAPEGAQPVAWQVRRADVPERGWEACTRELYEATLHTGRYAGYDNGPPCEVRALYTTPPQPRDARELAPWPDFAGNPIHHGDTLVHPVCKTEFIAVKVPWIDNPVDAWRAVYKRGDTEAYTSRLCLQIGDKGQAALKAARAAGGGG